MANFPLYVGNQNNLVSPQPIPFCSLDSYARLHTTTILIKNLQLITNQKTKSTFILCVKIQTFPICKQTHPVTKSFQQHFDHPLNLLFILRWEGRSEHTLSVSYRATSSSSLTIAQPQQFPLKNCFLIRTVNDNSWDTLCARSNQDPHFQESTVAPPSRIRKAQAVLPFSWTALSSTGIHCSPSQGSPNG